MNTDAYHNFLITGGPAGDDMPSSIEEALDEFEGNIKAICEEIGVAFTDRFMEGTSLNQLILSWKESGVGDALTISEIGWQVQTYTVYHNQIAPNIGSLNGNRLSFIAEQSTRRGRAPVISIVYSQDTNSN